MKVMLGEILIIAIMIIVSFTLYELATWTF